MLIAISPAKRLDWQTRDVAMTTPDMLTDANRLAKTMRNLPLRDLKALMHLSDDLARLNRDRYRAWADAPETDNLRPAALAFAGDTYTGLQAETLSNDDLNWAQDHLRILSGLYGALRPLDAIQPYRLEMGSRLKTRRGASLYEYWRDQIAHALRAQAKVVGTDTLINCASQEYFGAVPLPALGLRVVTPMFLEDKPGGPKVVSFFAKQARGAMARFVVQNRLSDPADLRRFETDGYAFQPAMSGPDTPVFIRSASAAASAA